ISLLAEKETIVGVIGDPAQSIYSFQGANIEDFLQFKNDNLNEYTIIENRRSSNQIIDLLNKTRKNITQYKYRNIDSDTPVLFVGSNLEAYKRIKVMYGDDIFIQTLSRDNPTANIMKFELDNNNINTKLLSELASKDNSKRYNIIKNSMEALEFAEHNDYKNAIEIMSNNFSLYSEKDQFKKSISVLQKLISGRKDFFNGPLMKFYQLVKENIEMPGF